jgi:hypothetical protein
MSLGFILRICVTPVFAALMAMPAWCTPIATYTDSTQWLSAVTGATDITFGGLGASGAITNVGSSKVLSGVTFSATPTMYIYSQTVSGGYYNFGGDGPDGLQNGRYLGPSSGGLTGLDIYLPALTTAFGMDMMSVSPWGATITVNVDGTPYPVTTLAAPNRAFFGLTSATPIAHINFTVAQYTTEMIDNFRFGTAMTQAQEQDPPPPPPADTPEAATMILIGSGLLGLKFMHRRVA